MEVHREAVCDASLMRSAQPAEGGSMESSPRPLILCIGNLLMGDEGVGVHAARALQDASPPDGVEILDGGTGGFHLLEHLRGRPVIVLIDAVMDGNVPGTVAVTEPRFLSDYPRSLGAHDIGLRDLLETAVLLGPLPPIRLVTVSIAEIRAATTELTPPVRQALPRVIEAVRSILREAGFASA
jgi:hydrogenase maturation protease